LAVSHAIRRGASFVVNWIGPEIHETHPVILQLRWRNQRVIWRNGLHAVLEIEVRADDDFVAVAIKRCVKCWVAIARLIKKQIKHHKTRTCREEPIEQQRPEFA